MTHGTRHHSPSVFCVYFILYIVVELIVETRLQYTNDVPVLHERLFYWLLRSVIMWTVPLWSCVRPARTPFRCAQIFQAV